ncbi:MAG: SANT/Myb domain-containing protein, partial [Holosporales bacterium]|nr:SANT/Myb domain-containing protein [Holosporales bacterium]
MKSRKFVFVLGLLLAACCDCSWGMSSFPPKNPLDQQEGGEIQHPKRNMFTPEEDRLLREHVKVMGTKDWKGIAQQMSGRNARQCRERWKNYLAPGLNLGLWTKDE